MRKYNARVQSGGINSSRIYPYVGIYCPGDTVDSLPSVVDKQRGPHDAGAIQVQLGFAEFRLRLHSLNRRFVNSLRLCSKHAIRHSVHKPANEEKQSTIEQENSTRQHSYAPGFEAFTHMPATPRSQRSATTSLETGMLTCGTIAPVAGASLFFRANIGFATMDRLSPPKVRPSLACFTPVVRPLPFTDSCRAAWASRTTECCGNQRVYITQAKPHAAGGAPYARPRLLRDSDDAAQPATQLHKGR